MDEDVTLPLHLEWAYPSLRDRRDVPAADPADARVWSGAAWGLSVRESEVIVLLAEGCSNPEIAERTFLSVNSVKTYLRTAYQKMGVRTRTRAVLWAIDHGARPSRRPCDAAYDDGYVGRAVRAPAAVGLARLRPLPRALGDRDRRILFWCDLAVSGVGTDLDG